MKKKSVAIVLIIAMLFTAVFTVAACDPTEDKDFVLTFDEENNCLQWSADWAITYTLKIYDGDGELQYQYPLTKGTSEYALNLPEGVYTAELTAYGEGGLAVTKQVSFTVFGESSEDDDSYESGWDSVSDEEVIEAIKIHNNTYYYLKSDNGDLIITPTNTSGVETVTAFGLLSETMWAYDSDKNTLAIKPTYLHHFSSGAMLEVYVDYADGATDCFNVNIVDVLPLQVIGGEDGVIDVKLTSSAVNLKINLGYDGVALREGSYSIVKAVCIDGKKRSATEYFLNLTQATVTLYNSKVLSALKPGLHLVEIFTTYGKSAVWINIINGKEKLPCDVTVDFDSSFPDIFVSWDIFYEADYVIVDISGEEYSSEDYPELFDGNSFDVTGRIVYGDTVTVKAAFDGEIYSSAASTATLDVNIDSTFLSKYLSYDDGFEFLGKEYNYYINDFDEFFDLVYYSLLFYGELEASSVSGYEKKVVFYPNTQFINKDKNTNPSYTTPNEAFKEVVSVLNEAVKYSLYARELEGSGVYEINLKVESTFTPNDTPDVTQMPIEQTKYQDTHFSKVGRAQDYEGFAVNSYEKEATVRLSEELYLALERGVRPVPVVDSDAYEIYEKAKTVLRQIVDDSMTDYQKVHAIYDWLGENVVYDWDITTKMGNISSGSSEYNKFYSYRQFYLEGVFIDGLAVCNGIAKAMSLMCGIEGIECYKIKGASSGGAHAWNKVKVCGNWYVVDATWANRRYVYNSTSKEVLSHYTIFMSEETSGNRVGGAHYESFTGRYTDCYAGSNYNVYANTFFTDGSKLYDYVIDSAEELKILIEYYEDKCAVNQCVTVDVSCDFNTLKSYLAEIRVSGVTIYDFNGAMSGVSTVVISK